MFPKAHEVSSAGSEVAKRGGMSDALEMDAEFTPAAGAAGRRGPGFPHGTRRRTRSGERMATLVNRSERSLTFERR